LIYGNDCWGQKPHHGVESSG